MLEYNINPARIDRLERKIKELDARLKEMELKRGPGRPRKETQEQPAVR